MEYQSKVLSIQGKDFIVVDELEYEGEKYYYLTTEDEEIQIMKEKDNSMFETVSDEIELEKVMNLFAKVFLEN